MFKNTRARIEASDRVGCSAAHQAESLAVLESVDEAPDSDEALSAFWGFDEDDLDLLA
jgi:hypothetical protein